MPFTIFSILEMFNTASYATMDAQDLKGTSLVIDNFNSASLATIGHGDLFNTGKRNQGTLVSTTGSSASPVKYYIYTQTSSGDTEFSGSEWTTLSNWAEILTSAAEFTASFVTSSDVYGPFGSNSILSASYAVSSSHALDTISSSFSLTSSYI